jgi:cyclophilin family peptidyl-prolyl cis-trans isomerase/HEAT repeat protein
MWPVLLSLLLQFYVNRPVLENEDARVEQPVAILAALNSTDPQVQRLAVRAIGRLERPQFADLIRPLLESPDAGVRMETVNALGQMNATFNVDTLIAKETDGAVRAIIYETAGRLRESPTGVEGVLVAGLHDTQATARSGAAKGLEAYFRSHRGVKPSAEIMTALHQAFRDNAEATTRELIMLTLNAAGDSDAEIINLALNDPEPQVRRLAVMASKQWKDDSSYIVRYEALKVAPSCERAASLVHDPNDHVGLLAVDLLGNNCSARVIERIVDTDKDWRKQAHAIVSLAKVDPESARKRLPKLAESDVWQMRVYAAQAAKIVKDDKILTRLARDNHPNVMIAAMVTPRDALRDLDASHYGLVLEAAKKLKGWDEGRLSVPTLKSALDRLTHEGKANSRDARTEILQRLREFGDVRIAGELRPYLLDFDPEIAKLAADIIAEKSGAKTEPTTTRYVTKPIPPDTYLRGLSGASATIKMRGAGPFTIQLLPEEAPITVATFAKLAESRYYNGLTLHRIVPNFVLQGGSPGASEYVGYSDFMRDELGLVSHRRGTLGISTRGRDTGDAQIFINLVDNFRLDHGYTVFARVIEGMDNIDKIQEGDVIESIEILRKVQP